MQERLRNMRLGLVLALPAVFFGFGMGAAFGADEDALEWLAVPTVWVPAPTEAHADVLGALIRKYHLTGNLVPDAHLAAIAIEHGLEVSSADTDFARFSEIRWRNPLAT